MAWVKLTDDFNEHRKFLNAGPLAGWLWVCALAYSNRNGTNGFVATRKVPMLADFDGIGVYTGTYSGQDVDVRELADALVDVGLWELVDGGYLIHDYSDYQLTTEELARRSDAKRRAGQAGGRASGQARAKADGQADALAGDETGDEAESKPVSRSLLSVPEQLWRTVAERQLVQRIADHAAGKTKEGVGDEGKWIAKAVKNAKTTYGDRAVDMAGRYDFQSVNQFADALLAPVAPSWLNGIRKLERDE